MLIEILLFTLCMGTMFTHQIIIRIHVLWYGNNFMSWLLIQFHLKSFCVSPVHMTCECLMNLTEVHIVTRDFFLIKQQCPQLLRMFALKFSISIWCWIILYCKHGSSWNIVVSKIEEIFLYLFTLWLSVAFCWQHWWNDGQGGPCSSVKS